MDSVISAVGAGGVNQTLNQGRMFINLKPRDRARCERRARSSTGCGRSSPRVEGIALFMQARRTSRSAAGSAATQYQFTFRMPTSTSSTTGRRILWRGLQGIPQLRDVTTDQQIAGPRVAARSIAIPRRGSASRRRPSTTRCTTRSASARSRSSSPSSTVSRGPGGRAAVPADPDALDLIYVRVHYRAAGAAQRAGESKTHVRSLSISHQGQFPAITLSFNLAPGYALGQAVDGDPEGRAGSQCPDHADHDLPGHRASVPELASNPALPDPGGADRGLHHPGRALRELRSTR